jgi:histone demethylase JARID1
MAEFIKSEYDTSVKRETDVLSSSGDISAPSEKRARRMTHKPQAYDFAEMENKEQMLLQKALANSRRDTKREDVDVPLAPSFYPTVDEFREPLKYIMSIRDRAEGFGICKIVPPADWNPKLAVDLEKADGRKMKTRKQTVHTLQEGKGFPDGKRYSLKDYKLMAEAARKSYVEREHGGAEPSIEKLRKDYWDIVETGGMKKTVVEYANDIDTTIYGSGFPKLSAGKHRMNSGNEPKDSATMFTDDYYLRSGWNLNNIANVEGSVLKHLEHPINGINVPWLYVGMLFASFCWHNEDNYLYSINYSHTGAVKQWYGVPGDDATKFEKTTKDFLFESFEEAPDLLHHMATQVSPSLLVRNGVPVYQITQEPKTFIITFPKAFHAGFSCGFNVGEAVNFATPDWVVKGSEAEGIYRTFARPSVFSHVRLLFTLVEHINDFDAIYRGSLLKLIEQVVDEELRFRPIVHSYGIRDVASMGINLPPNDFETIDESKMTYDDMRTCAMCKTVCVFTAIACECSQSKVCCLRHKLDTLCKCPSTKKYMMAWATDSELKTIRNKVTYLLNQSMMMR